jgi:hypothetical protein
MLITLGKSLYDPQVVEATRKYRESRRRRKKHLQLMKLAMQSILISNSTFEALDAGDEGDEEIRAAVLKELENEVGGEEYEERGKV